MITMSCKEVKICAKCRDNIYTGEARDNRNNGDTVHLKGQCVAKQANTVQKKLMEDISIWAANGGLRMLYGDKWEFSRFQLHHVLGRSAKHNKINIGHEFIIPVPFDLHDVSSNHELNVTHHKHAFTDEFGKQGDLFNKMATDMDEQGYITPDLEVCYTIKDTNA